jgi:hypothetical protein
VRTTKAQAAAVVGMLAAATGNEPQTAHTNSGALRIEAELPAELTPTTRTAILTALAIADRYGHARTETADTVWAEFDGEGQ